MALLGLIKQVLELHGISQQIAIALFGQERSLLRGVMLAE
jgi:hypothetical protein